LLSGIGVLVAVVTGLIVRSHLHTPDPAPAMDPFPLTPISESPFLNTKPGARYVGAAACTDCHKDRHASFRHTGMGNSMADVVVAQEPPDAVFDHPASKRRFQVFRRDGELWHRELLFTNGPAEVVLSEYPLKYVVGSGRHARTYLVETDGFLVESPVTWYNSRKEWDMSPGYDLPNHQGFGRAIGEACLYCHAGQSEAVGQHLHRMRLPEVAIGCERCHGPGSLHVELQKERQRLGKGLTGDIDYTIVNPTHLSRERSEAICQQCHLNAEAIVPNRGRKLSDFRPGLPVQDFFQVYVPDGPEHSMTVVGHVEQMHLSRCYQASKNFTCLTCHDPHAEPAPADRAAYQNSICQGCHQPEHCKVDQQRLAKESPDNNCIQCHMPRSKTDIPHLAFTHHRVGIHDGPATPGAGPERRPAKLKPYLDISRMNDVDRKWSLGEGYRLAALFGADHTRGPDYRKQALDLLSNLYDAGLRDGDLEGGLTQLSFDANTGDPRSLADEALARPDISAQSRCNALFARAQLEGRQGNYELALKDLRELTRLRRLAADFLLIARFTDALGHQAAATEALETAVRIDTHLPKVHQFLADYYRQQGDSKRAEWHQQRTLQ
jgi:predicted CXXCH cytochrome family protein